MIGIFVMIPIITVIWYPQDLKYVKDFFIPSFFAIVFGFVLCIRKKEKNICRKNNVGYSSLVVLFAWGFGVLIGALPFVLAHKLTLVQALFEAVSGWTTTGLSVVNVQNSEKIFLFHRSFMQYCGGLGFIMMMVMLIKNKYSMSLYNAEGHPDKIKPTILKTAQAIFTIYVSSLVIGTIAYMIAGMSFFDSICHCMCSLSTGGFSTKLNSIGEYNSVPIEIVTIVLMLLGTTNFATLILLFKGRVKEFFKVSEVRFMFLILVIFIFPMAMSISRSFNTGVFDSIKISTFNAVSALSTTGYSTMSYDKWPDFAIGLMILMMIIGGGIGSTAGGLKLSRVYIMLRFIGSQINKRIFTPNHVMSPQYMKAEGKSAIDNQTQEEVMGFCSLYMIIFIVGSLLVVLTANCSLKEAMFDFSSALGTVGLSIGITNESTNNATLIVEMVGMILGRLEIFMVIIGLNYGFKELKNFTKIKLQQKAAN